MTWPAVAVLIAAMTGQAFWIARALTSSKTDTAARIDALRADMGARFDAVGERITELRADVRALQERERS